MLVIALDYYGVNSALQFHSSFPFDIIAHAITRHPNMNANPSDE